jgi:hypothetical protein
VSRIDSLGRRDIPVHTVDTASPDSRRALDPERPYVGTTPRREAPNMGTILFIIAVIIAIYGIIRIIQGDILWGIVLLVVAALVGPGGYSIFG